jgi:hypothetical protein
MYQRFDGYDTGMNDEKKFAPVKTELFTIVFSKP